MEKLEQEQGVRSDGYRAYQSTEEGPKKAVEVETPAELRGKYAYVKEIGHGTQGHVYHAKRLSDGLDVAIKVLAIDSVKNWKEYELFQREVAVLSSLNMDGVAKFYEAIECLDSAKPAAYLVQEYVNGRSLSEMAESGYRMSINRIYDLMVQLLDILEALHKHDPAVIHRDIKPSNIIMKPKGGDAFDAYLIDFGAVANPVVQHGGSTVAGTVGYMPPEQLMGKPCPGSDIYALGALAVNLITGKSPMDMPVRDHRLIFEPDMQNMPQAVQATIRQMLEPSLELRMCDYEQLRNAFRKFKKADYVLDLKNFAENLAPVSYFSKQKYSNALEDVTALCMPGNLELWQRLPDDTPRQVPACFDPPRIHPEILSMEPLFSLRGGEARKGSAKEGMIIAVIAMLALAWCVQAFLDSWLFAILAFVVMLAAGAGIMYKMKNSKKQVTAESTGSSDAAGVVVSNSDAECINKLIVEGCKSIATVIDVAYIPTSADKVEVLVEEKELVQCGYHGIPSFTVRYKFNPPDDSDPNDLIHEVVIHSDPSKCCRPGDPLSILYRISYNGADEIVESIPFPFPLGDVQDLSHMIGRSRKTLK